MWRSITIIPLPVYIPLGGEPTSESDKRLLSDVGTTFTGEVDWRWLICCVDGDDDANVVAVDIAVENTTSSDDCPCCASVVGEGDADKTESSGKETLQGKVKRDVFEASGVPGITGGAEGGGVWQKPITERLFGETAEGEDTGEGSGLERYFLRGGWEGLSCLKWEVLGCWGRWCWFTACSRMLWNGAKRRYKWPGN